MNFLPSCKYAEDPFTVCSFLKVARLEFLGATDRSSLRTNQIVINNAIEKRSPQLNYVKMEICYDLCYFDIGVVIAT